MITYVNNSNAGQYRVLFEKATKDLMRYNEERRLVSPAEWRNDSDLEPLMVPSVYEAADITDYQRNEYYRWDAETKEYVYASEAAPIDGETYYKAEDISSLNEYFSYIKDLATIDPLYTVLPLDEDVFDIDLNTRKIEIPKHFKENGVSVQGDEIAEVVYFKVNRFFDAQDLAYKIDKDEFNLDGQPVVPDRMQIYIQWRSSQTGEDGKLIEGVSVPWVVDLTTYPNHILFGWPISSKITGKEGTIDFAIRFFKFKDNQVVYSLSTLTHSVSVKPSLDFDITEKLRDIHSSPQTQNSNLVLDDNSMFIRNRLGNSEVSNAGVKAGQPYFFMVENVGPDGPLMTLVDSTVGDGTGIIEEDGMQIQTSEGAVREFWLGRDLQTNILDKDIEFKTQGSGEGRISYTWSKLDENGNPVAITYSNKFIATSDTSAKAGKTYYIESETSQPDRPSYIVAQNPVFDSSEDDYKPLFEKFSVAVIDGIGTYYVTINNRVQNSISSKQSCEMKVARPLKPVNNTEVPARGILLAANEYNVTLETDAAPQDKSVLTYQWYYSTNNVFANAEPIEGATGSTYTIDGAAAGNGEAPGDGYYFVKITSNMNKEQDFIMGNKNGTRVTHFPHKVRVKIADDSKESYNLDEVHNVGGMKVQVIEDLTQGETRVDGEDAIEYQWYRYVAGANHNVDDDRAAAEQGTYEYNEDIPVPGATTNTLDPQLGGYFYYCLVTNRYNGEEAKSYSPFFYIANV